MNFRALVIALAFGWASLFIVATKMQIDDETKSFEHYCEMVKQGAWPDFKESIQNCK